MQLRTSDIFLSAYLINNKIHPLEVTTEDPRKKSRKRIVFVFPQTEDTNRLVTGFKLGTATANIVEFKRNFQYIRDLMFDKLRSN